MRTRLSILILVIPLVLFLTGCTSQQENEANAALATCLIEKGVHEYGAFWCPHCMEQSKLFGKADSLLKSGGVYIECDVRCAVARDQLPRACNGVVGRPDLCTQNKIEGYPTWIFPDGSRISGPQQLSVLAEKSGCPYTPAE